MKKVSILCSLCLLLVLMFSVLSGPVSAATLAPADWDGDGYLSTDAHGGKYALCQGAETGYQASNWQDVSVPNGTYTLTAWVKSSGGHDNCLVAVKNYGGGDALGQIPATDQWTEIKIENIPVTTGSAQISLWSTSTQGAWVLLDDVVFSDASGKNYMKNTGFEEISQTQVPVDTKPDKKAPDVISSRFFDKWTVYAEPSADVAYMSDDAHSGKYCGVHYGTVANYAVSTSQQLAGLPVGKYGASAWVKSSGGQKSCVRLVAVDGVNYFKEIPATDTWVKVEVLDIPVNNGTMRVDIWSESGPGNWVKYDDITAFNMNDTSANILLNGGFETLGENPFGDTTTNNIGAGGAGGDTEPTTTTTKTEEPGLELNDDDILDDILGGGDVDVDTTPKEEKHVDVVLIISICVIVLCLAMAAVTFVLLLRKKKLPDLPLGKGPKEQPESEDNTDQTK